MNERQAKVVNKLWDGFYGKVHTDLKEIVAALTLIRSSTFCCTLLGMVLYAKDNRDNTAMMG